MLSSRQLLPAAPTSPTQRRRGGGEDAKSDDVPNHELFQGGVVVVEKSRLWSLSRDEELTVPPLGQVEGRRHKPENPETHTGHALSGVMDPAADQHVQHTGGGHDSPAGTLETTNGSGQAGVPEQKKLTRPLKPLSQRKVKDYNEGLAKRGVVYLSRVPPFMKPAKIKHLMEQHGVVTRVSKPQSLEGESLTTAVGYRKCNQVKALSDYR